MLLSFKIFLSLFFLFSFIFSLLNVFLFIYFCYYFFSQHLHIPWSWLSLTDSLRVGVMHEQANSKQDSITTGGPT